MTVSSITSKLEFDTIFLKANQRSILFLWANWHEPSALGGQLHEIFEVLSNKYPDIHFFTVEAEAVVEVSEYLDVSVVPSFYTIINKSILSKLEGVNPAELSKLVKQLTDQPFVKEDNENSNSNNAKVDELSIRLKKLITSAPVMLFMKGIPDSPKCGFSRSIVTILKDNEIPFASFDILSDEEVRAGLKIYSDWPTYPQLYVNGNLIGGLDIVKEMLENGNLKQELGITHLKIPPPPASIEERLKSLINQAPVVVFIKGSPTAPKCGFSRSIISILNEQNITFASFDILSDEEVRAGLKIYSDWPTYPQLYVNGNLIGGLDIVKEMLENGNLKQELGI